MATVAITGSSGLIGSALVESLRADGVDVVRFVRRPPAHDDEAHWDPTTETIDRGALERADAVVHLAGEGLGEKRWTDAQKRRITESRIKGTNAVARGLADLAVDGKARVLVSGSAVGYYGLRGDEVLTETSTPGSGFLADLCKEWEAATRPAEAAGVRVVRLRTGIVLARDGALGRMLPLFRLGLGGKLGSGRQWWSWVSLQDMVGLARHAIETHGLEGPMNGTSPHPATNGEITKALGRVLNRPTFLAVPKFALSIAMGPELTEEMIMAGQRVIPEVAQQTGYAFRQPTLDEAMRAAVAR
jgi:uncharacterized protein